MNSFITGGTFNISNAEALTDVLSYLADGAEVTINLIDNIDVGEFTGTAFIVDSEGGKVTLDLNGFTISGIDVANKDDSNKFVSSQLFVIKPSTTFILDDSSVASTGKLTLSAVYDRQYSAGSVVINPQNATFILENGMIEHTGGSSVVLPVDLHISQGDTSFIMNGGAISSAYIGVRAFENGRDNCVHITINDGEITSSKSGIWVEQFNMGKPGSSIIQITGGSILSESANAVYLDLDCARGSGSVTDKEVKPVSLMVSGGTLETKAADRATIRMSTDFPNDNLDVSSSSITIIGGEIIHPTGTKQVEISNFAVNPSYTVVNVLVSTEVTGSKNVTQGVSAVFTAAPFNISAETPVKYEWSVDGTVVGGFTGETFAYTFDAVGEHVVSAAAIVGNAKAVGSFDVTVEAVKEIPKEEDQIQAGIKEETDSSEGSVNNNADFGSVNFSNQEFTDAGAEDQTITLAVKGNSQDKVEEHKALIPSAKKIVASYNITAADTTTTPLQSSFREADSSISPARE